MIVNRDARDRAGVLLIEDGCIALIKRVKGGSIYYVIPGGGIESGETPLEAARREAQEELGITVASLQPCMMFKQNDIHHYFLVGKYEGTFGTGEGYEYSGHSSGSYEPVWMPLDEAVSIPLYPEQVKSLLVNR
ncbi:NUDIX hydrolase [Rossellomorea marisflavi]|uniref:NUDIX hydrolase n=1 Tax=Rossellomorea marisflavi TaxID=189381 RepID=UPI003D2EC650